MPTIPTIKHILSQFSVTDLVNFPPVVEKAVQLPNVSRVDLLRWCRELDFRVAAEVGVAEGEYSKLMCEINPQMTIYGIDPYKPYKGYRDYTSNRTFNSMHDEAHRRLDSYIGRDRYKFVHKFSMDALKDFPDGSLDFVYIDGNHQDPFVTQDIYGWWPKVRPGGIFAGHDYVRVKRAQWQVKDAIHKFTLENNINPWFVLGLNAVKPGMVREGSRSWMIIKPE